MAHHNTVLRHFVAEIVFLRGSDCLGKKENLSATDSGVILLVYKFPLSVVKLSNML